MDGAGDKPKRPGGAERKRRNNEARKLELLAELRGLGWRPTDGTPIDASPDEDDGAGDFADLPDPAEADDSQTAMELTRLYQLRGLSVAAKKPLTEGLQKRLKFIAQFAEGIGMTQQRAELEERVAESERILANIKPHAAVKVSPSERHARPTRSRGARGGSRPRPVLGPAPGPRPVDGGGQSPRQPDGSDDPRGGRPMG